MHTYTTIFLYVVTLESITCPSVYKCIHSSICMLPSVFYLLRRLCSESWPNFFSSRLAVVRREQMPKKKCFVRKIQHSLEMRMGNCSAEMWEIVTNAYVPQGPIDCCILLFIYFCSFLELYKNFNPVDLRVPTLLGTQVCTCFIWINLLPFPPTKCPLITIARDLASSN